jgi:tRNA U54 and U55 pseudouridine synthase Pus10
MCAVCQTDMTIPAFESATWDTSTETEIRLKCGHAFHATCIALSFRNNSECPVCRDNVDNMHSILENIYSSINELDTGLVSLRYVQGRDRAVQEARRDMKKVRKQFVEYATLVRQEKKRRVSEALKEMQSYRNEMQRRYKRFQASVSEVRNVEYNAMKTELGQDAAVETLEVLDRAGMYSVRHFFPDEEVLKTSFWKR